MAVIQTLSTPVTCPGTPPTAEGSMLCAAGLRPLSPGRVGNPERSPPPTSHRAAKAKHVFFVHFFPPPPSCPE